MFMVERKSPPAAATPPSAAEPAAGIASHPDEDPSVPAATFLEASPDLGAAVVRQWAIGPEQCRWIVADEDRAADALMCGAATAPRRPFCIEHCARAYMPRVAEDGAEGGEEETPEKEAEEAR
ncbi:hypothetical protein DLREEDagr8_23050 [Dongia sp. agr-C8]